MKKITLFIPTLLLLTGILSSSESVDLDESQFLSVDEVRPGMSGYGLTVFSGTKIDTFRVEVLGVLENISPRGDIILARLSGGPLEKTGIFGGMSGSPIYIDNRLIGAAAYGWLFAKEPIAGITPIGEMLDLLTLPSEPRERRKPGALGLNTPSDPVPPQFDDIPIPGGLLGESRLPPSASGSFLRQWGAPVALAGFDDRIVEIMAPFFERFGLIPVQGGSTSGNADSPPLEPGSTVAAQLVRGDASISVLGTVTYRQGDRVLAFGHPMFRSGPVDLPMTGAVVHTVFPSQERSFKIATATPPVGSVRQDRRTGVAGKIGQAARMIPCDVEIRQHGSMTTEQYHYELADDHLFTPNLVGWTATTSLLTTERFLGKSSVRIQTVIEVSEHEPITIENFYSGDLTAVMAGVGIASPVAQLMNNPFEEVDIHGIRIALWSDEVLRTATIDGVRIDKLTVRPGDPLELTVTMKPHLEETITERLVVTIPEGTPEGVVTVLAADAKTIRTKEIARAPFKYRPENLQQLIELLEEGEQNNSVFVIAYRPMYGITVRGEELPSPPTSFLSIMASSKEKGESAPTKGIVLFNERVTTNYFITGSQTLNFSVERTAK